MRNEYIELTLADVCEVITDGAHYSPKAVVDGFPMGSVKDLSGYGINYDTCKRVSKRDFDALVGQGCSAKVGDVLIAKDGNSALDTVCVHRDSRPIVLLSSVAILRPNTRVLPDYLAYYLAAPSTRSMLKEGFRSGSAIPRVLLKDFKRAPIPVPPKSQQEFVVSVLLPIDERIELNRKMNTTLETMARALFQSWFVDFDPVRAKMDGREPEGMDKETAALFPNSFQDSTAGQIPSGWRVMKVSEFIERLSVGQKYEQKTVAPVGEVPVLDQGKSGVIGYHNNKPGVPATLDKPVAIFANHTCYMRLITYSFSAIQNVLPFVGSGVDTIWAYYATEGRLSFSEYKGHWPDFVIQQSVVPPRDLSDAFGRLTKPLIARIRNNEVESRNLATLRDALLPKLLSGEISPLFS